MSSMFKKKTGPSIKPKFVPRGRPAAPSTGPTPAPPPSTAATASSTPQPPKDADAPTQRVPSPRAQRRGPPPGASKASDVSPRQPEANATADQAPSAPSPRSTRSQPTERSTASIQPKPQARATPSERPHAVIPAVSQSLDRDQSRPTSTQAQQPAIPATPSTSTPTDAAPLQGEKNLSANSNISATPQPSTAIRPSGLAPPTPSTQPVAADEQPTPDGSPAVPQLIAGVAPKPTPTRRPRKRAAAAATPSQQESDGPIDSIEPASQPAKRARQRKTHPQTETPDGAAEDAQPKPKRQRRRRQTEGEEGGEGASQRRQSRARSGTPAGAEEEIVDIQQMKMSDLTRDLRIGKKFSRHDELRDRERQDRARRSVDPKVSQTPASPTPADARPSPGTPAPGSTPTPGARAPAGPQFQIVNGQIVVDQSSLVMDRHARDAIDGPIEEIEENEFTHKVTSNSYRTGSKLRGPNHWSPDDTEKFYEYLAMHGTDFSIITSLFPGRQRRHIKMKFNREEKFNRSRIDAALIGPKKKTMGFEEYKKVTGREYDLTEDVQAELDRDNEEREAALRAKEEADARENQQRLEAIHGTGGEKTEKEGAVKK